ncbi:MAG: GTP-sensing pleiotropic transcriptional regulator CodY [Epulopiscium sp.]|jgi:transcriptional pleiotropic repressor|nr:GTP-sensing pleiotropic transcriptional regulator CodY [Candidatus Epulonipiscium sp.]
MSVVLLEKTRKLNYLLQRSGSEPVIFNDICRVLNEVLESSTLVISKKGKILGSNYSNSSSKLFESENTEVGNSVDTNFNDYLLRIIETKENVSLSEFPMSDDKKIYDNLISTVIPISAGGERLGTLLIYKENGEYSTDDLILGEYGATVVGLEILRSKTEESAEELRKTAIVNSAIATLSYSELEAILHIFEELDGNEGLLVASKIADRVGITRSVIVNALRKFESAGVIESRSLGMKGTYIKVLNDVLLDELNKLRN